MKVKKVAAAFTAAAVLAAAAPMTGALPDVMSVSVGAESFAQYKVGDVFYAAFDGEKWFTDYTDKPGAVSDISWVCTVLEDNTISVHYISSAASHSPDFVPSQIAGYTVTAIDSGAYWTGTVTIPDTVISIGDSAFADCDELEEVKFGTNSQLKLIDQWAFQNCRSLKSITIPASVETIAYGAFSNINYDGFDSDKYSLESVIFADGSKLKAIGEGAFQYQEALKSITLPDSLSAIGKAAFVSCYNLEEVNFGANSQLKLIDEHAFENCRSLKSITIPASVETIALGAFMNVNNDNFDYDNFDSDIYSLESVIFAEGSKLKTIEDGAFYNCINLKEITIPANVSEIGAIVFSCSVDLITSGKTMNISNIDVDPNNQSFKSEDGVLFSKDGKTVVAYPGGKNDSEYEIPLSVNNIIMASFETSPKLTAVTIPEGVTEIPDNTFSYCTSLSELKLPNTLKAIGKWAFEATKLTSVDIPESVTSIDKQAFEGSTLNNINGVEGSYAETYAKENGYTFNNVSFDNSSASDTNTLTDNSDNKADETIVTTDAAETAETAETAAAVGSTDGTDDDKNVSTGAALSVVPVLLSVCALAVSCKKKK